MAWADHLRAFLGQSFGRSMGHISMFMALVSPIPGSVRLSPLRAQIISANRIYVNYCIKKWLSTIKKRSVLLACSEAFTNWRPQEFPLEGFFVVDTAGSRRGRRDLFVPTVPTMRKRLGRTRPNIYGLVPTVPTCPDRKESPCGNHFVQLRFGSLKECQQY